MSRARAVRLFTIVVVAAAVVVVVPVTLAVRVVVSPGRHIRDVWETIAPDTLKRKSSL